MIVKTGNVWMKVDEKANIIEILGTFLPENLKGRRIELEPVEVDISALRDPFEIVLSQIENQE